MRDGTLTRRTLLAASGAGMAALGGLAQGAKAAEMGDAEKANVKLVADFCKSWKAKDFDPDKEAAAFLSDDCSVRMVEDQPAAVGPAAVAAVFKSFMTHGERIAVTIHQTFANGPVVVNTRTDTMTTPGKPDQAFKVVGVFIVKKGKIKEWSDYLLMA